MRKATGHPRATESDPMFGLKAAPEAVRQDENAGSLPQVVGMRHLPSTERPQHDSTALRAPRDRFGRESPARSFAVAQIRCSGRLAV